MENLTPRQRAGKKYYLKIKARYALWYIENKETILNLHHSKKNNVEYINHRREYNKKRGQSLRDKVNMETTEHQL